MYSQCPECLTRFRVTAAALRAARGTVRCGRCGSAFDALPRLTDTLPEPQRDEPAAPLPTLGLTAAGMIESDDISARDDGTLITEFHFSPDDIDQVFVEARDWDRRFSESGAAPSGVTPANADDTRSVRALREAGSEFSSDDRAPLPTSIATGAPEVWVHEPERIEDITLEGERIVIEGLPDETSEASAEVGNGADVQAILTGEDAATSLPEDEFASQVEEALRLQAIAETARSAAAFAGEEVVSSPATPFVAAPAPPHPVNVEADAGASAAPVAAARGGAARTTLGAARFPRTEWPLLDEDEAAAEDSARPRWVRAAWGIGALLLALVLAAQLIHHYRQVLARDAVVGPTLQAVYRWLGLPLAANWDLGAFELRQWGAGSGPSADGHLDVRASLRNGADFAQPMPLLRLDLEDRYGGTVARRDFTPAEYLKDPAQATRLLAPGTSTEAELAIAGATSDAVGYRLDVCLRDAAGAVTCSQPPNDASRGQ